MQGERLRDAALKAMAALAAVSARWEPSVEYREEGRVVASHDGVLRVTGLPGVKAEELLRVGPGIPAMALDLSRDGVQAAVLGDRDAVREGHRVRGTGQLASIPVGDGLLGRVVDPTGRPLDGAPLGGALRPAPLERPAPPIYHRDTVHRPLYTGTLAIDAMFPIGRGQRELIIGDEGTGRTSLALTAMLRQQATDVVCVYVAIGRRRAETWQVVDALRGSGARWVAVSAPEDAAPGLRYLAPYAGTAVAEHFRDRGEHALVVYDDLSAHAIAWRELSLLMERPPGREAYPGDVFYLHARLLERATQLCREQGGGSLTALPIVTTEDGRLSAYIPTNLIAITDGQVVLSRPLFAGGQKPAVDAGLSVSRVGGKAQAQAFRRLAGGLKLEYAAFLELESFARVGTRLEESAQRRLALGRRLRQLLRAPRLAPMGAFDEIARLVFASRRDALAAVPEEAVGEVAEAVCAGLRRRLPQVAERIETQGVLTDGDLAALSEAVDALAAAGIPGAAHG